MSNYIGTDEDVKFLMDNKDVIEELIKKREQLQKLQKPVKPVIVYDSKIKTKQVKEQKVKETMAKVAKISKW